MVSDLDIAELDIIGSDLEHLAQENVIEEDIAVDLPDGSLRLDFKAKQSPLMAIQGQNYLDYPYLSLEEEQNLSKIYYNYQESTKSAIPDENVRAQALDAAHRLVMAHMRYVVKLARQYVNYGLPINDLIQEGAVGLMKAVQHFNPFKGVRLVSFAVHWIKSEIHNYIVCNWRMVKIATTKAQRKLFFNFRRLKASEDHQETVVHRNQRIAENLQVDIEDVEHMAQRFSDLEVNIDSPVYQDRNLTLAETIPSLIATPEEKILGDNQQGAMQQALKKSLALLNVRDTEIIKARFFSDEPPTLKDLSEKFGISIERVRQLEKKALQTLKTSLLVLQ